MAYVRRRELRRIVRKLDAGTGVDRTARRYRRRLMRMRVVVGVE